MINMSNNIITRLEHLIVEKIPVTRHLHFHIHLDENHLPVLEVPLQPNMNHLGTAFGGSLSMLCTIEGWVCMYLFLEDHEFEADIVIQRNEMVFTSPVQDDFYVLCEPPEQTELDDFVRTFKRFRKARISIKSIVREKFLSSEAARFRGVYAAIRS